MNTLDNKHENLEISGPFIPLLTIKQFSLRHKWPEGGLRHLVFYKPDGFERAIRRVGRKVLIHEAEFFAWIDEQNKQTTTKRSN